VRADPIVRGVLLVWFLKFTGGFVVSVAAGIDLQLNAQGVELVLAASDILFGTVGFTIAGCLSPPGR